jgi:hypothetical protein
VKEYTVEYAAYLNKIWKERKGIAVSSSNPPEQPVLDETTAQEQFAKLDDIGFTKSQVQALSLDEREKLTVQGTLNNIRKNTYESNKTRGNLTISNNSLSSYGKTTSLDVANKRILRLSDDNGNPLTFNGDVSIYLQTANFINCIKCFTQGASPNERTLGSSPFSLTSS